MRGSYDPVPERDATPLKKLWKPMDRQADHRVRRTFDPLDEETAVALDRVRARLVHRLRRADVPSDPDLTQLLELDVCGTDEALGVSVVDKRDRRVNGVDPAGETSQHAGRLLAVPGLAQDFVVQLDDGIRSKDRSAGMNGSHGSGLVTRCAFGEIRRYLAGPADLVDAGRDDDVRHSNRFEQVVPAGRAAGEDQYGGALRKIQLPSRWVSAASGSTGETITIDSSRSRILTVVPSVIGSELLDRAASLT